MIPGWMTDRGFSEGDLVKFKSVPGEPGMVICHDGLRPVEDQEAAYTWREIEGDYPDGVHLFCTDLRKAPTMDFYTTLTDAIGQEIIPLLGRRPTCSTWRGWRLRCSRWTPSRGC